MTTTLQVHALMHRAPQQARSILLLASMLLVSSAEPPPPSYRFDLIHVDAYGNFTREELIQRAANRTFLREATLSATDSTASSTEYSVDATYSPHEYLMELGIGIPPKPFRAVADTGSDVAWAKEMKLCDTISTHGFTPKTCFGSGGATCSECKEKQCRFTKTYGTDHKTATLVMGSEMVTLSNEKKVSIPFGCAFTCSDGNCHGLLPGTADGLVGLDRGPNSLMAKLRVTKFSYCFSSQLTPKLRSQLWFGDGLTLTAGGKSGATVNTTSLLELETIDRTSVWAYKYYIRLLGISIGGKREDLDSEEKKQKKEHKESVVEGFKVTSETGKPNMFVDSGCSYSLLEKDVFQKLMKLLKHNGLKNPTPNKKKLICFATAENRPQMVLHFAGADMYLPWNSYMLKDGSLFCLAIKEHDGGVSVLGNFQQQNIHMLYDLDLGDSKLSFVRVDDCSKL